MSHLITLFNELSLTNKIVILLKHSHEQGTKVRIRRSEILSLNRNDSGYKLSRDNSLNFMENHLALSRTKENKQTLNQFLHELHQTDLKANINIQEFQKSKNLNRSRILTTKIATISN